MTRKFGWMLAVYSCTIALAGLIRADENLVIAGTSAVRPVAAVLADEGKTLLVAGGHSGSIVAIDWENGTILGESFLPNTARLSDLARLSSAEKYLALDEAGNRLLLLEGLPAKLKITAELAIPRTPVRLAVSPTGQQVAIASLWAHQVTLVKLPLSKGSATPHQSLVIDLPFPPRELLWLPATSDSQNDPHSQRLLVAGAFRAELAIISTDPATAGKILATHFVGTHNLRGLVVSTNGKDLIVSQQLLDETLPVTRDNISRGALLTNILRQVPLALLGSDRQSLNAKSSLINLDTLGNGAADPADVQLLPAGGYAVALAGVNEVAFVRNTGSVWKRTEVGGYPQKIVLLPGAIAVICQLEDRVDILETTEGKLVRTIWLRPKQPELSARQRGERLFYNARLSHDHWYSCHSCHPDGHTSGLLADTAGDGTYGAPKRTLTLLGTRLTDRWAWNGSMQNLQDQVLKSLDTTMHSPHYTPQEAADLLDFLHTLSPPPPLKPRDANQPADIAQIERGVALFKSLACVNCHIPPLTYTAQESFDVNLTDALGQKKFNPPSLRGVGQGERFFHDSRAKTLENILTEQGHQLSRELNVTEVADLVRFLHSL